MASGWVRTASAVCVWGVSATALLAGRSALAQTPPLPEADVIVVTAQKREQDILKVGATVDALGAAAIDDWRVEEVSDFVAQLSNVTVKDNSPGILPVVTIRGVGLNDFSATNNPAAGVYVDEVYLSSLALLNADFFDLARLEALKGPQGTLYGRNSTAGALNIISARPSFAGTSGRVAVGYGDYKTFDADGFYNVPVSDQLALRFSGKYIDQGEGFFTDTLRKKDIGQRSVLLGRAQALFRPTDRFEALLKIEGQRVRSQVGAGEHFGVIPNGSAVCPSVGCRDFLGYFDPDTDPYRGAWSVDPTYDVDQLSATLRVQADLGFATLTSITGYADFQRVWGADTDGSPFRQTDFIENDDIQQLSQEVRLSGSTEATDWIVGAFYSSDDVVGRYDGFLQDLFNTTYLTTWDQTSKSAAVFGHVEHRLSEKLSAVAGLRYTWEEKDYLGRDIDLVSACPGSALSLAPCGAGPVTLASADATIDDTNWSWKLGLNYQFSPATLAYASVSEGVKSGGFFSGVATNSGQLKPYKPETLRAFEVGVKQRAASVQWTAAAFYYDYTDVQTFIRDEAGGLPIQRLGNVGEATIYGADLSASWSPAAVEGLTLSTSIGLLESELGAFTSSTGPVPKGKTLPDAPSFSSTTGADYRASLSDSLTLRLQGQARYTGKTEKDSLNDPLIAADSYWVLDGRIALESASGWDLALWVKNLADERYRTQGVNNTPLGYGFRVYGPPRTFGVSLSQEF
jgi:iron complex outermembrane receptor protein